MRRRWVVYLWFFLLAPNVGAQTGSLAPAPTSDPQAITLAAQAAATLTQGVPLADVTLSATATWIVGSDYFSGPVTLKARGTTQSRLDLNLNGLQRSEIRSLRDGALAGAWTDGSGQTHRFSEHNCYTEAAWFSPPLWSLFNLADPTLSVSYLWAATYNSLSTLKLRFVHHTGATNPLFDKLTSSDMYLDPTSLLPVAITFNAHPDNDAGRDIPVEVRFTGYRSFSGVLLPSRIQKLVNGGLMLDISVQSATVNTGLSDLDFAIQ